MVYGVREQRAGQTRGWSAGEDQVRVRLSVPIPRSPHHRVVSAQCPDRGWRTVSSCPHSVSPLISKAAAPGFRPTGVTVTPRQFPRPPLILITIALFALGGVKAGAADPSRAAMHLLMGDRRGPVSGSWRLASPLKTPS